jgi:S-adenosylmethionine:tRNA ribosyltransferase-isomerase
VQRREFRYELPEELIAQAPLAERSSSRLLVLDGDTAPPADRAMRELPGLLRPGDLLVFNDTRVIAARLRGAKPSGGRVEVLLERPLAGPRALVQLKASKPIRPGLEIRTAGGTIEVLESRGDLWCVRLPGPAETFFDQWGEVPLPPYIRRPPHSGDRERYQSVFARAAGAVAAPTASLHFDETLLADLERRGVARAFITLHVGVGTFQPVRVEHLSEHVIHTERCEVSAAACSAIREARARGGRVVAVGTTVARTLEAAARRGGDLEPWSGETDLFIQPGYRFAVIDALLTNFHLPESTLLMLVCALGGRERVLDAYTHAVRSRYRFFSYGDAMLVLPGGR